MAQGERVDAAIAAFAAMNEVFANSTGGWWRIEDGAAAMVTRTPVAQLNNVRVTGPGGVAAAAALLDEIAAEGLPHCLQTREGDAAAEDLARSRGMAATARVPFMVAATGGAAVPDSPVVRVLGSGEVGLHVDAMRDVFGLPDELLRGSALLDYDGVTGYVTEDGGDVAGTALGIVRQGHVGVFNVATRPASRGRGHGAALTARVLADGAAAGAGTALLQSSPLAVPLYERAGFAIAEHWTVWIG